MVYILVVKVNILGHSPQCIYLTNSGFEDCQHQQLAMRKL